MCYYIFRLLAYFLLPSAWVLGAFTIRTQTKRLSLLEAYRSNYFAHDDRSTFDQVKPCITLDRTSFQQAIMPSNEMFTTKKSLWREFLLRVTIVIISSTLFLFTPFTPRALALVGTSITDRVERVVDGDTIITTSIGRIRMIGMNTPEMVSPAQREKGAPPDCYGPEASAYTKKMLPKGTIIRFETDKEAQDKYGRSLGYIFRQPDDTFINGALVQEGFAYARSYKPNIKYDTILKQYQEEARKAKRGLWGVCETTSDKGVGTLDVQPIASLSTSRKTQLENPGDTKNCKDFEDYAEAKAWYDKYFDLYGDVAKLDGDGDGIPCKSLLPISQKNTKN